MNTQKPLKTSKAARMAARIENHGQKLNAIFNTGLDPVTLCKKLRRLEAKQTWASEDYCNGVIDDDQFEIIKTRTRDAVIKILGTKVPVYINSDPRGYALKIDDQVVRDLQLDIPRDWGGYGLLAPDLSQE
jgi:hypothetical protein